MPVPRDLPQDKVIVNGQKANDLGREPRVVKPWRDPIAADAIEKAEVKPT